MSVVSNNIKYLRRLNGLTQEQFARRIGIKRSLLGAYEEARANPNLDNLMSIAKAFHTTVDNLLKSDLRKIRETPDLSIPLDSSPVSERAATPYAPALPKERPEAPSTADPKPLSAVLEKYYQGPTPRSVESPRPVPAPPSIKLVAQRVVPRPVSQREGFGPVPRFAPPTPTAPPLFNNAYEPAQTPAHRPAVDRPHVDESPAPTSVQWVRQSQFGDYQRQYQQLGFLNRLPAFQLPLPPGHYRAFEAGNEFAFPGALLVGQFTRNWYDIADGRLYVLLVQGQGVLCRRVFNQVKVKGTLLLTADQPAVGSQEIPIRDILEVWEVKAFFSQQLPEQPPSLDGIRNLIDDLRFELDRIQKK